MVLYCHEINISVLKYLYVLVLIICDASDRVGYCDETEEGERRVKKKN